ncbi:MAG: ribosome-associated translation inhibitor RaiA [Minisyncoccia bacterium]|jgi:ribosomal subunit interface protein
MNYNIKGTEVVITPEIREYLVKRLERFDKFMSAKEAARADVELGYKAGEEKRYRAEIMLFEQSLPVPLRAVAEGGALYEAIDKAAGDIFIELTREKKKKQHVFRRGAARIKEYIRGFRSRP